MKPKFQFSNVVVVAGSLIGVILKTWQNQYDTYHYDVYVRSLNTIKEYQESDIEHFVYSKVLSEDELEFYL